MAKKPPKIQDILAFKDLFSPPLAIIPLLVKTKMPAVREWSVDGWGQVLAEETLREVWSTDINPGIATGRASMVVVVDADNEAAVAWVEAHLPATPMVTITRHGRHYYYRYPADREDRLPNVVDALGSKPHWAWRAEEELGLVVHVQQTREQGERELAAEKRRAEQARGLAEMQLAMGPIIDVRADGGQVVAPGAIHPSGFVYEMKTPWSQALLDAAPVFDPAWFADKRWRRPGGGASTLADLSQVRTQRALEAARSDTSPGDKLKRARAWIQHPEPAVQGANGSDRMYYVACRLVQGFDLPAETAFSLIMSDYNPRCQPPWSESEVAHKVEDAAKTAGPDQGFMLVDRPGYRRSKVTEHQVYDAYDELEFDEEPGEAQRAAAAPKPVTGELTDDEQEWAERWRALGVDYQAVRAEKWTRKKKGKVWTVPANTNNLAQVIKHSRFFDLDLRYNNLKMLAENRGQRMTDYDLAIIKRDLDHLFQEEIPDLRVQAAVNVVAEERKYEPAQDWLHSLPAWDGVPRLESFPARVMGADPEIRVNGLMFRHWMTGLVARIEKPGTKFDTMLLLVSRDHGTFKSQFFRQLIDGDLDGDGWFTDTHFNLKDKDGMMQIGTNLVVEWGESEHAKSAKMIDTVKAFLSRQDEEFRAPYARHVIKRPRRCVFGGTSNDDELLHDSTGSRRFYIIRVQEVSMRAMLAEREMLFAEALDIYRRWRAAAEDSEEWHATRFWFTRQEDKERLLAVRAFESKSPWYDDIDRWVEVRGKTEKPLFTVDDVVADCLLMPRDRKKKAVVNEVQRTLQQLGCRYLGRQRQDGVRGRYWAPPAPDEGDGI